MTSLYLADGVRRTFRSGDSQVSALDDISFEIQQGELVAIAGPSGSGKTTLLHVLGMLDPGFDGGLDFQGQAVPDLAPAQRCRLRLAHMGFVFQGFHLLESLDVLHNVAVLHWRLHGSRREAMDRAEVLLGELGMSHRLRHHTARLSAGEKQRVALARALVNEPRVILADEPTGNLDSENTRAVVELLTGIHGEGRTVVVVSHDPEVLAMARRVLELRYGRLTEDRAGAGDTPQPRER